MTTANGIIGGQPAADRASDLQAAALAWYEAHGRDLAFRRTSDPWAVLVSEVMAQQTQAARAAEAWTAFIDRYPTPTALANATMADVIRAWRGLGYNRRAVALRAAAIRIVEDYDGLVPDSLDGLEALPGIGPYTARAVLAIAFGRPVAALDTNIRRVLDRTLGPLPTAPKRMQSTADDFVPQDRAGPWTHALMDVGATFCRKREPRCDVCPLVNLCGFARSGGGHSTGAPATSVRPGANTKPRRRAPRFESTGRWLRGRILDRLRDASPRAWVEFDTPLGSHDRVAIDRALAALERERFLELRADGPAARLLDG